MACSNPSPETRFGAARGNPQGRVPTRFLHARLSKPITALDFAKRFRAAATSDDPSIREAFVDRLVEIAFTDEVMVIGRDSDGEPIKRLSSAESINAIKTLWSYDLGKAPASKEEMALKIAEHFRQIARDQFDVLLKMLGDDLHEKTPAQMREYLNSCDRDPRRYLQAATEALGLSSPAPGPQQLPEQPQEPEPQPDPARVELPEDGE